MVLFFSISLLLLLLNVLRSRSWQCRSPLLDSEYDLCRASYVEDFRDHFAQLFFFFSKIIKHCWIMNNIFSYLRCWLLIHSFVLLQRFVIVLASVAALVAAVSGQRRPSLSQPEENYPPQPFEFSYTAQDEEGSHSHSQQGDGTGRVTGEYTIQLADGRTRTVR